MISNYEFQSLSENEKAEATWNGIFLGNRREDGFEILLYWANDLHLEVFYNDNSSEIIKFRSFKRMQLLAAYITLNKY